MWRHRLHYGLRFLVDSDGNSNHHTVFRLHGSGNFEKTSISSYAVWLDEEEDHLQTLHPTIEWKRCSEALYYTLPQIYARYFRTWSPLELEGDGRPCSKVAHGHAHNVDNFSPPLPV